jgi:hypothetical protein
MRDLTTGYSNALDATVLNLAFFVMLTFKTSVEYVWTGIGDIVWNGNTWQGLGVLGSISSITEGTKVQADGISLTLSGIPVDLLADSLTEVQQGLPVKVYLALFVQGTSTIIPDPVCAYSGLMDQPEITIGTETVSVTIAVENKMVNLQRSQNRRMTDADQRMDYPNDDAFLFVQRLQDANFAWT